MLSLRFVLCFVLFISPSKIEAHPTLSDADGPILSHCFVFFFLLSSVPAQVPNSASILKITTVTSFERLLKTKIIETKQLRMFLLLLFRVGTAVSHQCPSERPGWAVAASQDGLS